MFLIFLKFYFNVDRFYSLYWICYNIASVFTFLVFRLPGIWDPGSLTRNQTRTPCVGRQSLNHGTAREVPLIFFFFFTLFIFIIQKLKNLKLQLFFCKPSMVRTQGNIKQLLVCSEDTSSVLWFILEKQEKNIKWTFFLCHLLCQQK